MTSSNKGSRSGPPSRPVGNAKAPVTGGVKEAAQTSTPNKPLAEKLPTSARSNVTQRPIANNAPTSTRQARLAMQQQRRRNQQIITNSFIGVLTVIVIVIAIAIFQAFPKPATPAAKPRVYGLLSDFSPGAKGNLKGVTAKPVTLSDGVQYVDIKVGTGAIVKPGATITANYSGWLTDGTLFDASANHGGPTQFPLSGVIKGWTEAIPGMAIGGERRLFIPSAEGYGPAGSSPAIPPNADLIFDVGVVSIP